MHTTTATESLIATTKNIADLVESEMTLRRRIDSAKKVIHLFNNSRLEFESAKQMRRTVLGRIHLKDGSTAADLKQADVALRDAEVRAEGLSDNASGASFALERLEPEAKEFHDEVARLRNQLPAMQYAAACEYAQINIDRYIAAADSFMADFASLAGSLMTLEQMRNSKAPPFDWHELFPCGIEFPAPPYLQQFGFAAWRSHDSVALLAAAQKKVFAEHLHTQGII